MLDPINNRRPNDQLDDFGRHFPDKNRYPSLSARLAFEFKRAELSSAIGVRDEELIDQLMDYGFDGDTIAALSVAPIALVAWGSSTVTNREFSAAIESLFESSLPGNNPAIRRFRQWLKVRPARELWDLWKVFVQSQLEASPPKQTREDGAALYQQAERVALASGGLLGIGQICSGERRVLHLIRDAYGLDASV